MVCTSLGLVFFVFGGGVVFLGIRMMLTVSYCVSFVFRGDWPWMCWCRNLPCVILKFLNLCFLPSCVWM